MQIIMPSMDVKTSGIVENATIPLRASANTIFMGNFVLPATLTRFSYAIHLVLNPTHEKIPFVKR